MDDHNEMYEIGLTAPMEMAEEYRLDEMLPMMGLKIGKRCIILISSSAVIRNSSRMSTSS